MFERFRHKGARQQLELYIAQIENVWAKICPGEGKFFEMNINDWIESQTHVATHQKNHNVTATKSTELDISVFTFLRDTHGSQTLGDGIKTLALRKVDPKIVYGWMNDPVPQLETTYSWWPIKIGYPELTKNKTHEVSKKRPRRRG